MYLRFLFAVAVMIGLTAFAPAPFPREQRKVRESENDLLRLQGTWKVTGYERPGLKGRAIRYSVNMTIRISPGKWEYVYNNNLGARAGNSTNEYQMKIDPVSRPRKMTMTKDYGGGTTLTMNAIYKIEGPKVKVMYVSTYQGRGIAQQVANGPLTWENPPTSAILMTLERTK